MSLASRPADAAHGRGAAAPVAAQRFRALVPVVMAVLWLAGGNARTWAQIDTSGGKAELLDKPKARAKMLEHYRAKLEVKEDAEWNIIQARIENVLQAQRDLQSALVLSQRKSHSPKASGSSTTTGKDNAPAHPADEAAEAEVRALQKLVQNRAPAKELKPQLARVRDLLRARQDKLASAREDLRMVLSSRQEAIAVLSGLLR